VYSYANLVNITKVIIGSGGLGTFTYTSNSVPVVNEGFVLSGFTLQASFLNGQTVYVLSVTPTTFTAYVTVPAGFAGTYTMQSGTGTSTVGIFVGPNPPTVANDVDSANTPWNNIEGILGDTSYASVTLGFMPQTMAVTSIQTIGWSNPQYLTYNGGPANNASIGYNGANIIAAYGYFTIPTVTNVVGMTVAFDAYADVAGSSTTAQIVIGLANAGVNGGTTQTQNLTLTRTEYYLGGPAYLWGFTAAEFLAFITSPNFNVTVEAARVGNPVVTQVAINNFSVTLYYYQEDSDALFAQTFNFTLNPNTGITGVETSFQAYSSTGTTSLQVQLLKNGTPVGTPKTQVLTTVPTVYSLGGTLDEWGTSWAYSDINSLGFGVSFTAVGDTPTSSGVTYVNDNDVVVYITPGLDNFNYIKTYIQNNQQINTLALDASGNIWLENVTSNPGILTLALTGIIPGSFAQSATADGNEYIMLSNLQIGTDRPRLVIPNQETGALMFEPVSQEGPGAPPSFQAIVASATGVLTITSATIVDGIVTFTFTAAPVPPAVGSLYKVTGTGNPGLNGFTFTVLGTPAPTTTTFSSATGATGSGGAGTATPTLTYTITNITQGTPIQFNGQSVQWGGGKGSPAIGPVMTLWYGTAGSAEDPQVVAAGDGAVLYIASASALTGLVGTWLLLGHGTSHEAGEGSGEILPYIQITYLSSGAETLLGNNGQFQFTLATVTLATPAPDLESSDIVQINGATPVGWDGNWTILTALNSTVMTITMSEVLGTPAGTAQFTYNVTSVPAMAPVNGQEVTITGTFNANGALNTTGVISAVTGGTSGTFQVSGFTPFSPAQIALGEVAESGAQAVTFGTMFTFDPGATDVGTNVDPIYGTYTGGGTLTIIGGSVIPIGPGTRKAVCFFITESGYYSPVSPFVIFTTTADANYITATHIPIGPPNTIARAIAFTEAGQNGVPGENFYIIPEDVIITVGNTTTTYTSTIIHDNITSTASFTFTDEVLLDSEEIDIQGADQFNLIELGSSAWVVPYASRNFYGMQLNKVTNFDNLTFDGGYLSNNPQGVPQSDVILLGGTFSNLLPLGYPLGVPGVGWQVLNPADQTLVVSPVTGDALYIKNTYLVGITAVVGMIWQTAYQDQYQVAIIEPNTTYSVRVAVSNPSGNAVGHLTIDLVNWSALNGFTLLPTPAHTQFELSAMTTNVQVFTSELLITPFTTSVPSTLVLRVFLEDTAIGSDVLIDRIEVFPTLTPYLLPQVYGSYANDLEAIDASDTGGIIDTTSENSQTCYGGFVMHDLLYLLKLNSWYSTEQNPNSEPGGWALKEVSNKVGACGIHAYDTGEEWAMTACREGIFGFNGGQPIKLSLEIFNLWNCINWDAAYSIVLRNDVANKRFYCAIPLPTGTSPEGVPTATVQWLPDAAYNPSPTTPNVILMCNYQGLDTAQELFAGPGIHVTMFGSLAAMDMKRKWTIWQIPTPYMALITQQNGVDQPLYICNGIASSKIYQLETTQYSDDGKAINGLYTTYGHVNAVKAATQPIFGMHTKRYTILQGTVEGAGTLGVRILPNVLDPVYPYSVPVGVNLVSPAMDDFFRPINVKAQRAFLEFSTNAVGSWFHLDKTLLSGKADAWSSLNPTGGMNNGIVS